MTETATLVQQIQTEMLTKRSKMNTDEDDSR